MAIITSTRTASFPASQFGADQFAYELLIAPLSRALKLPSVAGPPVDLSRLTESDKRRLSNGFSVSFDFDALRALWLNHCDRTVLSNSNASAIDASVGDWICIVAWEPNPHFVNHWFYTQVAEIVDDSHYGEAFIWISALDIRRQFDFKDPHRSGPKELILTPRHSSALLSMRKKKRRLKFDD